MEVIIRKLTMSHLKRFYVNPDTKIFGVGVNVLPSNESLSIGDKVILDATQSNHLKNTLRLKLHSVVEVFNNHNESYLAKVSLIPDRNSSGVEVEILSKVTPKTIYIPDITLACAIAKGNRMDWLIEKTAEMGLTKLIPVITKRTVVKMDGHHKKIERWHKLAISAAKQTGQNSILEILPPLEFDSLGNLVKDFSLSLIAVPNTDKYLPEVLEKSNLFGRHVPSLTGHLRGSSPVGASGDSLSLAREKILYLIGPEGDFTPDEINVAMKWGVQPVRLPVNAILRVETAAITMLAMLLYHFGKMISKKTS